MAAELGETSSPKDLIPGDPATVQVMAASLRQYGDALHEAGAGLQRVDTTDGWSGQAADAFRNAFHGEPRKWLEAGDCFHEASQALDTYSFTLSWAQSQANEAIHQWNEAQAATHAAETQHAQAVDQAERTTPPGGNLAPPATPFVDPGEAKRQAAQALLDRARGQLTLAGNQAADTIARARNLAPPKPSLLDQLGETVGNAASDAWHGVETFGKQAVNNAASLLNAGLQHPGDVTGTLGGTLLAAASVAGEGGGIVLDATGALAPAGATLNVASAAGITTGVGIAGASMANMASHASGDDRVEPLKNDSSGSGSEPPFPPPEEITGTTEHAEQQIAGRDGHGVNDAAIQDAVENPVKEPKYRPDQYGGSYRYTGKDAIVNLNKDGQITTAWAKSRAGWRHP